MPKRYPGNRPCQTCGELCPPQNQFFCSRKCKRHGAETREKISAIQRGVPKPPRTAEHRKNMSLVRVGKPHPTRQPSGKKHPVSADDRRQRSDRMIEKWQDPEWREKMLESRVAQSNRVSRDEARLAEHLVPLGWRHTGGGGFWIRRGSVTHAPDFVKVDTKEIIELWGDYWHAGEDPAELIEWYRQSGWTCQVVWCSEMDRFINEGKVPT